MGTLFAPRPSITAMARFTAASISGSMPSMKYSFGIPTVKPLMSLPRKER